ncbi:MAG TPA: apolipoprotein N-acyltransferase [Blastocatellia bacterium]|nr:apolipoprotein N-acyltransferase [Blastocatellia bacterium]
MVAWNGSAGGHEREGARRVFGSGDAAPPALSRADLLAARFGVVKVLNYQRAGTPFVSNISLAILSGLLLVFAFPDWNFWSFGWIAVAPLIMASAREQRFWSALLLGLITGTIFYVGSSYWVDYSIHNYGGVPLWLCYVIDVVGAGALAIFTGLFAGTLARAIARFGGWAILLAPVLWAASEWGRLKVTGMGWNALGYSQAFQPSVIQSARWGGVYLVSALLVSVNAALVFAMIYLERRRGVVVLTIAGIIAAANLLHGQSLRQKPDLKGSISVGVVQPNIPIDGDWSNPAFVSSMVERHLKLSEQLLSQAGTQNPNGAAGANLRVLIWPESPMPLEYDRDPDLRDQLARFTRGHGVYLILNSWESAGGKDLFNSAIVIGPAGGKVSEYDKIALLPYGEYVPGRDWIPFMKRVTALVGDVTPGKALTLSDVAGARLGTFICFEVTRPDIAREMRRQGASALIQLSNEAWFGPTAAPRQVLAEAVFRAVENNVELIRSTNSGESARIDRRGNVYAVTSGFEATTRTWQIKTAEEARLDSLTFYTRRGDVFAAASTCASILVLILAFLPRRADPKGRLFRGRGPGQPDGPGNFKRSQRNDRRA